MQLSIFSNWQVKFWLSEKVGFSPEFMVLDQYFIDFHHTSPLELAMTCWSSSQFVLTCQKSDWFSAGIHPEDTTESEMHKYAFSCIFTKSFTGISNPKCDTFLCPPKWPLYLVLYASGLHGMPYFQTHFRCGSLKWSLCSAPRYFKRWQVSVQP